MTIYLFYYYVINKKKKKKTVLRNAMAFSALFDIPIQIQNIRAKREKPGLRPQHLCGIELVSKIANGHLEGGRVGSTAITFFPKSLGMGKFIGDIGTAGATMLLIQTSLPCLLFAPGRSTLVLTGGTNAEMAPQVDYTTMVI